MGQALHGSTKDLCSGLTRVAASVRYGEASLQAQAKLDGINQETIAKWKVGRRSPTGPNEASSTLPSGEAEAVIVAFRRHTLLAPD